MLCVCLAFPHSQTVPRQYDPEILCACDKSSAAFFRRSADGSCKHGNPGGRKALKVLPLGLPSKTKGLLGLYDAHHQLKYLKDPAHFSEEFLGEIDYIKPSHHCYDCTMSHSCLLGFLCENLFQGTILCSLKQCLFGISIQRVTVTTKQSSLSNCSVELFASIRCQLS